MTRALIFLLTATLLAAQTPATKADVEKWMQDLSNWGRWGKDDQLGALNLITPAKRANAARLVRDGVSISLARDVEKEKTPDNGQPFEHTMNRTGRGNTTQFAVDTYRVLYHGVAHTHMDALCHMFYEGKMYNGFDQNIVTDLGAERLSIERIKNGIFTRAILLDIPALKGVPFLEPGTAIYAADLDAWEKKAGLKVQPGDVVFLRTGRWARRAAKGPWDVGNLSAGLHASAVKWLKQRDVAMVGSDAATDVMPSQIEGVRQPVHQLLLVAMGVMIFDNCDLEALSAETAKRKHWEFLLTASPLVVRGGTGSPLNPIATF